MPSIQLIDTHCHLNFPDKFPDPAATIEAAKLVGVSEFLVVGIDEASNQRAIEMAKQYDEVFAIVGWHPNNASSWNSETKQNLADLLTEPKVVALGEIGLDFHWDYSTVHEQEKCLLDQLEMAQNHDLPVVIHCREAYKQLLPILENAPKMNFHFHCFAGDLEDANRCLALNGILGIDGPITYKKNAFLRELVATLPLDRFVLETDSPFLSPEPLRSKPNSPANLPLVNSAFAVARGISEMEAAMATTANAQRFFQIEGH